LSDVFDALGKQTHFDYDHLNRRTKEIDADGATTILKYDAVGNLILQQGPRTRTGGGLYEFSYTYDALNRRTLMIDAEGKKTTYDYDAGSNLLVMTDALGYTTTYSYDFQNRATKVVRA